MYKNNLIIGVLLFVLPISSFSTDFGKQKDIKTSRCSYQGAFIPSTAYDVSAYIKTMEMKVVKPYVLKIRLKTSSKHDGSYYSIIFYKYGDKKYAPVKDLSVQPEDRIVLDSSTSLNLRTYYKRGVQQWAPVIYKKGLRENVKGKDLVFFNFLKDHGSVTDLEGNLVGDSGNFFTYLMYKNMGLGAMLAEEREGFITEDSDGFANFFIYLNPKIKGKIFLITGYTKLSVIRSDRGLRSTIKTISFDPSQTC